jgi:hypothetical protein
LYGCNIKETDMGLASYSVKRVEDGWSVEHEGVMEGSYLSKETAFEAIAMAASNSVKDGHEIRITVPGREGDEASLGTPAS